MIVFGERHLRHLLGSYLDHYNETRTHLSLDKDAPISRAIQAVKIREGIATPERIAKREAVRSPSRGCPKLPSRA